ncbi:Decorin binding protein [Borreliella japonica]|uniref:Decorin binding protein n=1 Tax=Borreliella japonica TaxID=34095 RepID=A0A1G4Q2N5_BORJA|nr:decorin-binding protein DbpA [Borreliella japonica]WKC88586.1 decorin-binding protein DbpA [Borreliella japonica]SCW38439.1 Decorin binding protein [Borreliella japonica]
MTKYNKNFKNLLKLTLLVKLFIACGLTGEMKAKLESSAQNIQDEIDQIAKEAAEQGVKLESHTDKATGGKVSENPFIFKAKIRAITVAEKFLKAIEEEATSIKESGNSSQFSAMNDLMLKTAASLEKIGIQNMTGTVSKAAEKTPPNTAEGVLEIVKAIKEKFQRVYKKNKDALDNLEKKNANNTSNGSST